MTRLLLLSDIFDENIVFLRRARKFRVSENFSLKNSVCRFALTCKGNAQYPHLEARYVSKCLYLKKRERERDRETFLGRKSAGVPAFLPGKTSGPPSGYSVDTYNPVRKDRGDKTGGGRGCARTYVRTYVCDHLNFRIANSLIHGDAMAAG